jgi:DNA-binding MarR family transcriptional regulator
VEEGWIERKDHSEDQRKTLLNLSAKARKAMDELFSWPDPQSEAS